MRTDENGGTMEPRTMTWPTCAAKVAMARERLAAPLEGLEHVIIDGLERMTCPKCGTEFEAWPKSGPLMAALTFALASKPRRLTTGEWRWLRRRVDPRAKEFAVQIGVTPEIVSKWENGKAPISSQTDRLVRALAVLRQAELGREFQFDSEAFAHIDDASDAPIEIRAVLGRGWKIEGADAPGRRKSAARAA